MLKFVLLSAALSLAAASGVNYYGGYSGALGSYGYGSYGGYPRGDFIALYQRYSPSYSRYFYNYCNNYIQTHPRGRYLRFARRYLSTFRKQYLGSYGYAPYGASGFYGLYKQYSPSYSRYFYNYCNNYIRTHPRGRYLPYARRYIFTYRNKYLGGYGYGRYGAGRGFYTLYKRYSPSYSRYFYNYCNNYIRAHPKGRYLPYARRYIFTYRNQFLGKGYNNGSGFYALYKLYSPSYNRFFYNYCNNYIRSNPKGRYLSYARRYVATYPSYGNYGYGAGSGFYALYKRYSPSYSPYFYNYCNKYIRSHPYGRYLPYARKYIATFRKQYATSYRSSYSYGSNPGYAYAW